MYDLNHQTKDQRTQGVYINSAFIAFATMANTTHFSLRSYALI